MIVVFSLVILSCVHEVRQKANILLYSKSVLIIRVTSGSSSHSCGNFFDLIINAGIENVLDRTV